MKRVLTINVGTHSAGEIIDWPMPTWTQVANGLGGTVDDISHPYVEPGSVDLNSQSTRRGPGRPRKEESLNDPR